MATEVGVCVGRGEKGPRWEKGEEGVGHKLFPLLHSKTLILRIKVFERNKKENMDAKTYVFF